MPRAAAAPPVQKPVKYRVRVIVNELNVRQGPGRNHAVVASGGSPVIMKRGAETSISSEATCSEGLKWGRTPGGWIALKHCEIIG